MNLSFESNIYSGYKGDSIKLTCYGTYLHISDLVWIVSSISNPLDQRVIYSDNSYIGSSSRKYSIDTSLLTDNSLSSTLTILNVNEFDALNSYECVCNIYKRCSNANHAKAKANIVLLKVTTTSNIGL